MTDAPLQTRYPDRKISDTLLMFAKSLIDGLGPQVTPAEMETSLKMAVMVWNAVVFADVKNDRKVLDVLQQHIAHDPELARLVKHLIQRKRSLFSDDERLIGDFQLRREGGEWRLRAEARDPRTPNPDCM